MRDSAARSIEPQGAAPQRVTLIYREVGNTHVFTSPELRGFHIGMCDLNAAFDSAVLALGEHVSLLFNCKAKYHVDGGFVNFESHLKGGDVFAPMIIATRSEMYAH
jgi:hypothetical protein